jgi:hypothetical protein
MCCEICKYENNTAKENASTYIDLIEQAGSLSRMLLGSVHGSLYNEYSIQ